MNVILKIYQRLLTKYGEVSPHGPDSTKQWIEKGKVVLSGLIGDKAILRTMNSNEIDTNSAYDHMCLHEAIWEDAKGLMHAFLNDEKNHKAWLERQIEIL